MLEPIFLHQAWCSYEILKVAKWGKRDATSSPLVINVHSWRKDVTNQPKLKKYQRQVLAPLLFSCSTTLQQLAEDQIDINGNNVHCALSNIGKNKIWVLEFLRTIRTALSNGKLSSVRHIHQHKFSVNIHHENFKLRASNNSNRGIRFSKPHHNAVTKHQLEFPW